MQRKLSVPLWIVVVLGVSALDAPAQSAPADPVPPGNLAPPPGMVAALQRDLHLTAPSPRSKRPAGYILGSELDDRDAGEARRWATSSLVTLALAEENARGSVSSELTGQPSPNHRNRSWHRRTWRRACKSRPSRAARAHFTSITSVRPGRLAR